MSSDRVRVHGVVVKAQPVKENCQFGPWTVSTVKSHILESEGLARESFEGQLELPQVPDMVFADNVLRIEHTAGFGVEFCALDALKCVDAHHDPLKVAVSQAWMEARADSKHIKEVVKPFDWTFTTDYKGTMFGKEGAKMHIEATEERIDIEKLKVRERIHFYDDIHLFEDELSDNGTSILSVKIRVMPTSFLILMRLFMRVDNVIVRMIDTRYYHEADKNYILREHCFKESKVKDIKAPAHVVTDVNSVSDYLAVKKETFEKLIFPEIDLSQKTDNSVDGVG